MGVLYLALDPAIDRLVALKLLRTNDDDLRRRFEREARTVGRFQHVNIVTIYDVGKDQGEPFIAMEYVAGETLAQIIKRQEPLDLAARLRLVEELCAGLAYAHGRQVVHRDIKPANLMRESEFKRLKILDFGIARAASADAGTTSTGVRLGTPSYMAPENLQGQPIDHRCDVFGVGLVLYELLSYQRAFPDDDRDLVTYRVLHDAPRPLEDLVPGLDPELIATVGRALEKDPARRYQDLALMAADLRRIREGLTPDELASTIFRAPKGASPPPLSPADDRIETWRREREARIRNHLQEARTALSRDDVAAALAAAEQAVLLNPDDPTVRAVLREAHAAEAERQAATHLNEARQQLSDGDLTRADQLVDQALHLRPESSEAHAVRAQVQEARAEREREKRSAAVRQALDRGWRHFRARAYDGAVRAAQEALTVDPGNADAEELLRQGREAIDQRRRQLAHERRGREVADQAREIFSTGRHREAIVLLESFRPEHALVSTTLDELRAEWDALQEEVPIGAAPATGGSTEVTPPPPPESASPGPERVEEAPAAAPAPPAPPATSAPPVPPPTETAPWDADDDRPDERSGTAGVLAERPWQRSLEDRSRVVQVAGAVVLVVLLIAAGWYFWPAADIEPIATPPAADFTQELERGDTALADERFDEALTIFDGVLERDPDNDAAREGRRQAQEAMADARTLAERQAIQVGLDAGAAALRRGDLQSAIASFGEVLALAPDEQAALDGRRQAQTRLDAQVSRQNTIEAGLSAAETALDDGDFAGAIEAFDEVLAIAPDNARALDGRGRAVKGLAVIQGGALR